jgi:hypothetical protein
MTPDHDHSPKDGEPSVVVAHWSRLSDFRLSRRPPAVHRPRPPAEFFTRAKSIAFRGGLTTPGRRCRFGRLCRWGRGASSRLPLSPVRTYQELLRVGWTADGKTQTMVG